MKICENCLHMAKAPADPNNLGARGLICRRFPPVAQALAIPQGVTVANIWPTIEPGDTCGEFVDQAEAANHPTMPGVIL